MRLTMMVLSILRVLPVARIAFILVLAASFLAAGSARLRAVEVREHKKTVPVERPHKKSHPATKSGSTHSTSATTHRARSASTHRVATHTRSRVVRTSAVHTRSGKRVYHYSTRVVASQEIAPRPHSSSVESASLADSTPDSRVTVAKTPQEAASRIVDREDSTPRATIASDAPLPPPSPLSASSSTKIVAMAPLRGSLESLVRQNEKTDADNLERILNDDDLHSRIAEGSLVPVPISSGLTVNPSLPGDRRYCRPWTASFLNDFARAHEAEFHRSFEVSSAVRTVEYQKHLMRTNGNAAPAEGDIASPHLTGATIDIAKSGLSRRELYWMRNRLNALQSEGKIDVEEEFHQSCFHITVYKSYTGAEPPHRPKTPAAQPPSDDSDDNAPAEVASH